MENDKDKFVLPHNRFYRKVFSKKANLIDLLKNALPKVYIDRIDFDSIKLSKESFTSAKLSPFWSDMVINAKLNDEDVRITLLIEHKANYDKFTVSINIENYPIFNRFKGLILCGLTATPSILSKLLIVN